MDETISNVEKKKSLWAQMLEHFSAEFLFSVLRTAFQAAVCALAIALVQRVMAPKALA